ncbi:jg19137 [Pararge aegeria aegeria]|uniref:Jg19137 protein n=1 Tax=Pararge aegeria aegeria TaxID=348720 RepID=A0A8S4RNB5_9NEOP|nr:jg19137 [Pararge aegeria aegeria]
MSQSVNSINSPRSRAPIDENGVMLWNLLTGYSYEIYQQNIADVNGKDINVIKAETKDKSTSTKNKESEFRLTNTNRKLKREKYSKDIILRKWRERQLKAKYELARKAIINSIKEKFGNAGTYHNINKSESCGYGGRVASHGDVPAIVITNADVEDTSNSNVNRGVACQTDLDFKHENGRVEDGFMKRVGGSHANRLQMGPGGELAQWRLAAHGSRAGAAGGLRGFLDEMPVS